MLLESHSMIRRVLLAVALATSFAGAAGAQQAPRHDGLPGYIPYGNLSEASPEDIEKAKELGADVASQMMQAVGKGATPEMLREDSGLARKADDIADATMQAQRNKVLRFLGLNPNGNNSVYVFLSWSMPLPLMRQYVIESMWSGATVVFKGIPPHKQLGQFIVNDLRKLVYNKGASANISLDPRLFDAYQVSVVPSIVLTSNRSNFQCKGVNPVQFQYADQTLSYDTCPPMDPADYDKVSGAVSLSYALQLFKDGGNPAAEPYLQAIAKGWAGGKAPGKMETEFTGNWTNVLSPSELQAVEQTSGALMSRMPGK